MRQRFNPMMIVMLALLATWAFRGMNNFDSPMDWVMQKVYILPGILVGLSFHEFAHAWVAKKLGDDTAERQGRVTINPAAHLDIVGFVSLLVLGFGWGIPVPVDERNFKHPRRDNILVSLAGVTMNLLLAVIFSIPARMIVKAFSGAAPSDLVYNVYLMIFYVVSINVVLMIFNLIPCPPLDGWGIITQIFRLDKYSWWYKVYQYGTWILLALIVFNVTDRIITPLVSTLLGILLY